MAKKELVKIETFKGEQEKSTIYVMSREIKNLSLYEKSKAITQFINKDTKVLEMAIENHLRQVLRSYGIVADNGSQEALEKAFNELELKGIQIAIIDRYFEFKGERIIAESPNAMTIIDEDGTLSCAIEVCVNENNDN